MGRALIHHQPVLHEHHLVGRLAGQAHLVGDHDDGHVRLGERLDDVEHLLHHLGVKRARGLVEQHDLRVHVEGAGDGHALLLAAGELVGVLVHLAFQPHALKVGEAVALCLLARDFEHFDGSERHVLEHGLVRVEVVALEHHGHVAGERAGVHLAVGQVHPLHHDRARVGHFQAVDAADEHAFARAGRTDDDHLFALVHIERHALERLDRAETLADVLDRDRLSHEMSLPCASRPRMAKGAAADQHRLNVHQV